MQNKNRISPAAVIAAGLILSILTIVVCSGTGSVDISPWDIVRIVASKISGSPLPSDIEPNMSSIIWSVRIPRVLCAFFAGGVLSVCGCVMQSLLQNPLASTYTLGVSSGASLGAAIAMVVSDTLAISGLFLLPFSGFVAALLTVILVMLLSERMGKGLRSTTVILTGMVLSLFMNALLMLIETLFADEFRHVIMWQMGSFNGKRGIHVLFLMTACIIGTVVISLFHREMDVMTFGDDESSVTGVDTMKVKRMLIALSSLFTGMTVCFTGTIGFVDLITPHVVRKFTGPAHKYLIPVSMLAGGIFMALADTIGRTVIAPREIPVGAVTALIGAPFFIWIYLKRNEY